MRISPHHEISNDLFQVPARRRAPLPVVSDDPANDARSWIQSATVEGGYGP